MGEDFKAHIFEPFTQENQDARTNYNGVGLGMSIVKKLVDQMKGTVKMAFPSPAVTTSAPASLRIYSTISQLISLSSTRSTRIPAMLSGMLLGSQTTYMLKTVEMEKYERQGFAACFSDTCSFIPAI